jgi:ketoreductase RED2
MGVELDLTGKVAIVTGSSSGIGQAIAETLTARGVKVVVNSSRSKERGQAVADSLEGAVYFHGSVTDESFGTDIVQLAIEKYGRLDILVNNAGTTRVIAHSDLQAATTEIWREIFEVNVFGTWSLIRAAHEALEAGPGGQILNVTSLAGIRQTGSSIPYATSKAALNHLTKLLAATLAPKVRVNAVAPGLVDTPWTKDWDDVRSSYSKTAPLQRSATTKDVADSALQLIENPYLTGTILCLDGGMSLKR